MIATEIIVEITKGGKIYLVLDLEKLIVFIKFFIYKTVLFLLFTTKTKISLLLISYK